MRDIAALKLFRTTAEIAKFREHFKIGTRPRLALEVLLGIGPRRSDAATVGPQRTKAAVG